MTLQDLSWVATALTITGLVLNGRKKIGCWPVWLVSNVFWVISMACAQQWAIVVLNIGYVGLNSYNWWSWAKSKTSK